jgi:DNA-binding CsgD family transcriptional regulator
MALSARTERAVEACYDAVLVPALWPQALQQLADSLGAASGCLCNPDLGHGQPPMSSGHQEFADLWLRNQSHAPDPVSMRTPAFCKAGCTHVVQQQIVTAEEQKTLPYFHETARPGKREWWASISWSVADSRWCLSLYRDAPRGPFSYEEARSFTRLRPHLNRIIALAEKFAEAQLTSALSALERLTCGALVIDCHGVARHLNRRAENLLGDDFYLVCGRPAAGDCASNRRLHQLVASILEMPRGVVPQHNRVVIDRARAPWLIVETLPVTAFGSDVFGEARAVLLLTDLTAPPVTDSALLALVFGLTAAEAKLAACIASGCGIDGAAASLGIGRETARSQLRAVFMKTNMRSQAELVALVSRLRTAQ